jgi:hypothetical protein
MTSCSEGRAPDDLCDLVSLLVSVSVDSLCRVVSTDESGDKSLLLEFESVRCRFPYSIKSSEVLLDLRLLGRPRGLEVGAASVRSSLNELERELEREDSLDDSVHFSMATRVDNLGDRRGVTGGVAVWSAMRCAGGFWGGKNWMYCSRSKLYKSNVFKKKLKYVVRPSTSSSTRVRLHK